MLESTLHIVYSNTAATISLIVAMLFFRRRSSKGALTMSIAMICLAIWSASDLLCDIIMGPVELKMLWDKIAYIGIVFIPASWFVFALEYTNKQESLNKKNTALLLIMPLVTLIIIFTNNYHHLFQREYYTVEFGNLTILQCIYGPWFWIHSAYSYFLLAAGTFLIISNIASQPSMYKNQSVMMVLGAIAPIAVNILDTFRITNTGPEDPTVMTFAVTGIFFFMGMFRYKLFEMVPAIREAVFENVNEIVIAVDLNNKIIDVNTLAYKFFKREKEDIVGRAAFDYIGLYFNGFERYANEWGILNENVIAKAGTGDAIYSMRMAPLCDTKEKIIGRYIIMKDITLLESTMKSLKTSRINAEEASRAKSNFLATMSHEIRTPLNGIIGMVELLSSLNLDAEGKEYLYTIRNSADALLGIINDILDFSKIEAGKMEIENISFNVRELVSNIVRTFYAKTNEKNIDIVCEIDEGIHENVKGDPTKLRQVIVNLIGNAVKFTENGSVKVEVKNSISEGERIKLYFSVSDTGIGIEEEKAAKLFDSFEQLDNSTTRKYGGTGLGLAIVKNLINLMGGEIRVQSQLGKGSKFYFWLYFEEAKQSEKVKEDSIIMGKENQKLDILVAEDNKVNQLFMKKLLEKNAFNVEIAENGEEAVEMYSQKEFDIIFMDIQMPKMDGYEATRIIREKEKKHVPIIALTANTTEEDKQMCINAGMDDYIAKPVKLNKLYECINKFV